MKRTSKFIAGAAAVGALTLAGLGLAQAGGMGYGPGYGMGWGGGPGWGMGPGGGWATSSEVGTIVGNRLAALKSELKITPDQEKAWNAFADQAKQQAEAVQALRQQMHEQMAAGKVVPGSPEFFGLRKSMLELQQTGAEARATKVKDLYAVLTPDQKAVADQSLGGFGPGRGWGPRGGGWGPGGGGWGRCW
jgi:protein CpxP